MLRTSLKISFPLIISSSFLFIPFINLLLYRLSGSVGLAIALPLIRDLLILIVVAWIILNRSLKIRSLDINVLLFYLLFFLIIGHLSLKSLDIIMDLSKYAMPIANNVRRFLFVFLAFFFFRRYASDRFNNILLKALIFFWLFGIFEYAMPLSVWRSIGLLDYWNNVINKTSGTGFEMQGLDQAGKMVTYDLYYITGKVFRRMIGFYLEPTTTGSLAVGSVVFSHTMNSRYLRILAIIGGFLTFSKAFLLFLILYTFRRIMVLIKMPTKLYDRMVLISLLGFLIFGYFVYLAYPEIFLFGFMKHLVGLYEYFINFRGFGYGIAEVGSFRVSGVESEIGVESSLANIISQLGVLSILILTLFFHYSTKNLNKVANVGFMAMIVAYIFIFATSNSATGYSGNFLIIYMMAYYYNKNKEETQDIYEVAA